VDDRLASLLPYPVTVRERPGRLDLGAMPAVRPARGSDDLAGAARQALAAIPWPARLAGDPAREAGPELIVSAAADLGAEAYRLAIAEDRIEIAAGGQAGAFYAAQTLRQLLPDDAWRCAPLAGPAWTVPCADIEDAPALAWRGGHLDVSRHFFTKPEILRFIDALAAHKLNRLHLHLTDDQGWRIESRAYPQLQEIASHRPRTRISLDREEPAVYEEIPYGGYYTLADLAEIGAYAAARMVTVVPEIEVPGHASALLAALPQLGSVPGGRYQVRDGWGIFTDLMSPLPATLEFLRTVFGELLAALPAPCVHIGGDECILDSWRQNPRIEARRRELGLADAEELHAWMLRQVADALADDFGVRAVVWDEGFASASGTGAAGPAGRSGRASGTAGADGSGRTMPRPGLRQDTIVMAWRGMDIARRAAQAGHDVVVVPVLPTYFDYYQSDGPDEPVAIGGPVSVEDVAAFSPLDVGWPDDARWRVIGTQFQLWTEYIRTWRSVEYMAFPRGCALAEVAWAGRPAVWAGGQEGPDMWAGGPQESAAAGGQEEPAATAGGQQRPAHGRGRPPLRGRLAGHLRRLEAAGIEYRPLDGPRPWQRGGTGPRRHRAGYPVTRVAASLASQSGDQAAAGAGD
jgi:hexosaminidase